MIDEGATRAAREALAAALEGERWGVHVVKDTAQDLRRGLRALDLTITSLQSIAEILRERLEQIEQVTQ